MLRRLARALLAASLLGGVGCGSRTPLDLDDIYGDGDGDGDQGAGASGSGEPSGSGYVDLTGTSVPFSEVAAMTLVLWFQESQGTGLNAPVLSDRTGYNGMEFYRGVYGDTVTVCWGAGHPAVGAGGCSPFPLVAGGCYQVLFLRSSSAAETEVWLDGGLVTTLSTTGFDLFADADDMLLGDTKVGDLDGSARLRLDDVRLYDQALDASQRCSELGAFWCDAGCEL